MHDARSSLLVRIRNILMMHHASLGASHRAALSLLFAFALQLLCGDSLHHLKALVIEHYRLVGALACGSTLEQHKVNFYAVAHHRRRQAAASGACGAGLDTNATVIAAKEAISALEVYLLASGGGDVV